MDNTENEIDDFEKMIRNVIAKVDELDNSFRQIKTSIENLEAKITAEETKEAEQTVNTKNS
ncbi:hypothetical protein EHP00_59 [Ecytonucleospora hepatopenaei]|uniref:Uncharacterized protein n=1 Tax=Ecytonucleospora hepatopenaei TaxID=646526 RepID=A0A1W0E5M3_9MICR|nr:hypothetical protein EHP00_59 [Ecytonucleospora hepatopenaei]